MYEGFLFGEWKLLIPMLNAARSQFVCVISRCIVTGAAAAAAAAVAVADAWRAPLLVCLRWT